MTITDADAAIDADLAAMDLVEQSPVADGVVVDIASTPCTAAEAQALIKRAVGAANEFYEAVGELLSRDGHLALGYDSPRQMLSRELAGMLTNPRTGQPLSDTHLRRMTRVAWLAWSIAQSTGLDMSQLDITERQVRSISASAAGANDTDLIEDIRERLTESDARGAGQVNEIIGEAVSTYEERKAQAQANEASSSDSGGKDMGRNGAGDGKSAHQPQQPAEDADYDDDLDDDVPSAGPPPPAEPKTPPSVTSIFDTVVPDGAPPVSDLQVSSALTHMRTAADIRRVMTDAARILSLLPEINKIEKSVPHVIDAIDDDDLDAIRKELTGTEAATRWATKALAVITEAIEEVDLRIDEAI